MAGTLVQYLGTGRRKSSMARVFLRPGKGQIKVNNRSFEQYFQTDAARNTARQALLVTETADKFDVLVLTSGGLSGGVSRIRRLHEFLIRFGWQRRRWPLPMGFIGRPGRCGSTTTRSDNI